MKVAVRMTAALGAAALGLSFSAILGRSVTFRDQVGRIFSHGPLLAIASGAGIYETDVDEEKGDDLRSLVIGENLRARSANEPANPAEVQREFDVLRSQFGTEKLFRDALSSSDLTEGALKGRIVDELRSRSWLAKQVPGPDARGENECREFYLAHQSQFAAPVRFHSAHLFLAAPEGTPADVVDEKLKAISALSERLSHGEDFAQLVAEASEDEATKNRGGDLGIVSAWRMPPEFVAEVGKLKAGETSRPIRSHLGFHIVRLLDRKEAAELPFETVRGEIAIELQGDKRKTAVAAIGQELSGALYVGGRR